MKNKNDFNFNLKNYTDKTRLKKHKQNHTTDSEIKQMIKTIFNKKNTRLSLRK